MLRNEGFKGKEGSLRKNMELRRGGNSEGQQREGQEKNTTTAHFFCSWKLERPLGGGTA